MGRHHLEEIVVGDPAEQAHIRRCEIAHELPVRALEGAATDDRQLQLGASRHSHDQVRHALVRPLLADEEHAQPSRAVVHRAAGRSDGGIDPPGNHRQRGARLATDDLAVAGTRGDHVVGKVRQAMIDHVVEDAHHTEVGDLYVKVVGVDQSRPCPTAAQRVAHQHHLRHRGHRTVQQDHVVRVDGSVAEQFEAEVGGPKLADVAPPGLERRAVRHVVAQRLQLVA